jgi:hypothetical protein
VPRGLLGSGPVVGGGGHVSRVDASGQAVLGGDPAQQRVQLPTFAVGETSAELGLVLGGHLHQPVEQPPPVAGEMQGMSASVGGTGTPLEQPPRSSSSTSATMRLGGICMALPSACWDWPSAAATWRSSTTWRGSMPSGVRGPASCTRRSSPGCELLADALEAR